jgi:hypothetical protein
MSKSPTRAKPRKRPVKSKKAQLKAPAARAESKQARLIEMLKRPDGATIDEVVKALKWQSHTVRGAMAGAFKKKLGLKITSDKTEDRGRVYRIAN